MHLSKLTISHACLLVGIGIMLNNCGTDTPSDALNLNGQWQQISLSNSSSVQTVHSEDGLILAGGEEGVWINNLTNPGNGWYDAGLQKDSAWAADFISWNKDSLLALLRFEDAKSPEARLYISKDKGDSWTPIMAENPSGEQYFNIQFIELNPESPNELFGYDGRILRSNNYGTGWEIIYKEGGFSEFLVLNKNRGTEIWAGGWYPIYAPFLTKSEDGGETWTHLGKKYYFGSDATVYDVYIHPTNHNIVLAGTGGSVMSANVIRKTTDGGQSWSTVHDSLNTRTLTHSILNPEIVYASGRNVSGTLFFAASPNFGDTWQRVEMDNSPANVTINDMASVEVDGREVLYLATNKGLYKYIFMR